jgi:hypothetical protein
LHEVADQNKGPDVSGLETAIRNALERSERANPEVRARVYQSARQALEAGLRKQDITDAETISAQRQRLEVTIRAIEGEERQRLHAAAAPVAAPQPPQPARPESSPQPTPVAAPPPRVQSPQRIEPDLDPHMELRGETRNPQSDPSDFGDGDLGGLHTGPADHLGAEPEFVAEAPVPRQARSMDFKPERAVVRRKPRKFFSRLLVFCIVVAFLGIGAWWVKTSGVLLTASQRDTSVRNPPAHVDPQDYNGDDDNADDSADSGSNAGLATIDPQDRFSADWVQILGPTDASKAVGGAQAKIENANENEGPTVRLTSQSSGAAGDVAVPVPSAVLQKLVGGRATVAMTLQATSNTPTQITVECDFGGLGGCGRHRFDVTRQKSDALFQLQFSKPLPANATGNLVFNSDVDGKATGVNIYAIRVLPGSETP